MTGPDEEVIEQSHEAGQTAASPDFRAILNSAPEIHDILARPQVYEAWLAKAKEALNG